METTTIIEYAKMGITGTRIQTTTLRNKSLATTNIPNVGEVREGTNGRVIWSEIRERPAPLNVAPRRRNLKPREHLEPGAQPEEALHQDRGQGHPRAGARWSASS